MYGFSNIQDISGNIVNLESTTNMNIGDRIIEINGEKIDSIEKLKEKINENPGKTLKIKSKSQNGKIKESDVIPIHTGSNEYKHGLWVKDAATGVGTLSFYIPETNEFVALGHGIVDTDTNSLININSGELTTTDIISIIKGNSRFTW